MKKRLGLSFIIAATFAVGCASSEHKNRNVGAGVGAGTGAVLGGILGHQKGKRNEGAAMGAVIGGAIGGYAGSRMDKQAKELDKVAETKRTDEGLITKLKSDILFDTGKATLKPSARDNLQQMAAIMKKYPENVLTINGYTDNTGSESVNEELSEKRAEVVKKALVANGLPQETISTQGWGEENPVADNSTSSGRQKNRRVEIQVRVDQSKLPDNQTATNE